jgi:acyl carrier protein
MKDRIFNCLCTVFDLDAKNVTEDISQTDVQYWDSLGSVRLVLCLEEEFGVSIPPEVGRRMTGYRAIEAELLKLSSRVQ